MIQLLIRCAERGLLPDWLLRPGIAWISRERLREADRLSPEALEAQAQALLDELRSSAVARATDTA
ncbi:MAG: SAM-dependent methyltransferase, partial [Pseudomonadota bacterium]